MSKSVRFSPEVRERAVRMVLEHQGEHSSQWAAMQSILGKIGCTAKTLRKWVRQSQETQNESGWITERERLNPHRAYRRTRFQDPSRGLRAT